MSFSAPLAEIFSSFQGEGLYVGVRQVFVRLRGCELACKYCDTPAARSTSGPCVIEDPPGSNQWDEVSNPLQASDATRLALKLARTAPHHSVSFTGGEPLLHAPFVVHMARLVRAAGFKTYLDTACCIPGSMAGVAPLIDIVGADYKLPSTMREPIAFDDFAHTWEAIHGQRFIKIVLTNEVSPEELDCHCDRLRALDPYADIVLQPATARGAVQPPTAPELFVLAKAAAAHFPFLRVIPQCHPLLGVR